LTISNNAELESVALPSATTIDDLQLGASGSMPLLESVSADKLATLMALKVYQCGSTTSTLTPSFKKLQSVSGAFFIGSNPALESLSGFPALDRVGSFDVASNAKLPTCEATALRDRIQAVHVIPTITIASNFADSCTP